MNDTEEQIDGGRVIELARRLFAVERYHRPTTDENPPPIYMDLAYRLYASPELAASVMELMPVNIRQDGFPTAVKRGLV